MTSSVKIETGVPGGEVAIAASTGGRARLNYFFWNLIQGPGSATMQVPYILSRAPATLALLQADRAVLKGATQWLEPNGDGDSKRCDTPIGGRPAH